MGLTPVSRCESEARCCGAGGAICAPPTPTPGCPRERPAYAAPPGVEAGPAPLPESSLAVKRAVKTPALKQLMLSLGRQRIVDNLVSGCWMVTWEDGNTRAVLNMAARRPGRRSGLKEGGGSHTHTGQSVPGSGNGRCKGPEVFGNTSSRMKWEGGREDGKI